MALAFFYIFLGRGYGSVPVDAMLRRVSRKTGALSGQHGAKGIEARLEELASDIQAVANALWASQSISARNATEQNAYPAASSVIGTLSWSIGEWAAEWLAHLGKTAHLL